MTATVSRPSAAPGTRGRVVLSGVTKVFGRGPEAVKALDGVSLDVAPGEFLCLLGASGCGKSTLLNLVAGLEQPTSGTVTSWPEPAAGSSDAGGAVGPSMPSSSAAVGPSMPSSSAAVGPSMVFQDAALFPWLTVGGNIDLALRLAGVPRAERPGRIEELLELVHLAGCAPKRPHELSGGMRQRAALARALAREASVLLMDEPFGALDAMTRDLLHDELERIWEATGITVLFVTHNVREAVRLGDRVVLLSSRPGRVAATFDVDLPRPRRIESSEVSALAGHITSVLREEVARHGGDRR